MSYLALDTGGTWIKGVIADSIDFSSIKEKPFALTKIKAGSSLLVMGIAGGGLIPPLPGLLKDSFGSYQQAYRMALPVLAYFLYYALAGHKVR